MRQEAEFVKHIYIEGEWLSTVWFGILKEEFLRE
jgi:RimJ/RimL family protein N-acetyltransferase